MSNLDLVANELKEEGYESFRFSSEQGEVIAIEYEIPTGKHKGEKVLLGFSFPEANYPEYPPHWIHISPPYDDGLGGVVKSYTNIHDGMERQWLALSRPPSDFWDSLSIKHMSYYLQIHVNRFCNYLQ